MSSIKFIKHRKITKRLFHYKKNKKYLLASERKTSYSIHVAHQHTIKALLVGKDFLINFLDACLYKNK
jgi:hypothetical protein